MNNYTVSNVYKSLNDKYSNYIKTIYFGNNKLIREAFDKENSLSNLISQVPYIESNNAYKIIQNGISKSSLDSTTKNFLIEMIDKELGVFKNPYKHQIDALESFYNNEDVFIATGTGSGKTECFMWPMVTKMILESTDREETWKAEGIRTIVLYPMNALVNDQMGRLRKMIGDPSGDFKDLFRKYTGENSRIPKFGMYTGRTPYSGEQKLEKDKRLSQTLRTNILEQDPDTYTLLSNLGKIPSKIELESFADSLFDGQHVTDDDDAELYTRQEMKKICPDVLITNYSMLEYMLLRPIEQSLWNKTKKWLSQDEKNKLLFIIDEAHMYRGAAGGEVALLIRRLMYKLGIGRDRVQFIMTSASIPGNSLEEVNEFACNLSGADPSHKSINIIIGDKQELMINAKSKIDVAEICKVEVDEILSADAEKSGKIIALGDLLGFDDTYEKTPNGIRKWLGRNLNKYEEVQRIIKLTRGNAISLKKLVEETFPDIPENIGTTVVDNILSLLSVALNDDGSVMYPARLHTLFKGLTGVYSCINPNCKYKNHVKDNFPLGKIYFEKSKTRCECGGLLFELLNDRSCGALFLKGYITEFESNTFVWNLDNAEKDDNVNESHVYIVPDNIPFGIKITPRLKVGWLNSNTGKFYNNDDHEGEEGYLRVVYTTEVNPDLNDIKAFKACPKCGHRNLKATDFSTKGNEPFFNLVSEELYTQPPTIFKEEDVKNNPNAGRKVLLFSDSRQRAAKLAKDLTRAADEDAMKKALALSAKELQLWSKENPSKDASLNILYASFLKVASENNLKFFYGEDEDRLQKDMDLVSQKISRDKKRNRKLLYNKLSTELGDPPGLYSEQLLRQLCNSYRSFVDSGLGWIEPFFDNDEDYLDLLDEKGLDIDIDTFNNFFVAWAWNEMTDSLAIGDKIDDKIRETVKKKYNYYGLNRDFKLPSKYKKILLKHYNELEIEKITDILRTFIVRGKSDKYYINTAKVKLRYEPNHEWYKCPVCSGVFPHKIWGQCARCGLGTPAKFEKEDFESLSFWRAPVLDAINGDSKALMTRINTEEHTAQLSHKDQNENYWSTTEKYEMQFQNVYTEAIRPVDVLSCTTTMEVGIDIGSLVAVGLRNIPPRRENYQQRAGRAGRRSSSTATIMTYTDNGPHDRYYFNNPEKIIKGEPRIPWIDLKNKKLLERHLNVIYLSEFMIGKDAGLNDTEVITFFDTLYDDFLIYLGDKVLDKAVWNVIIPPGIEFNHDKYKEKFILKLNSLKNKVENNPDLYTNGDEKIKFVLDVLLEEAVFPTYSFPRNIVSFHIENSDGDNIQRPDRALDIAVTEYAPGKVIVVNKKTYKSGGIYDNFSKYSKKNHNKPAMAYFDNPDYFKKVFKCKEAYCNWIGLEKPHNNKCIFCGSENIEEKKLLKPWGFAPQNGRSITESEAENEISSSDDPCYSERTDNDDMIQSKNYQNIRYAQRYTQPLSIINQGNNGFLVCKKCGAAVIGDNHDELKKIKSPFNLKYKSYICSHFEYEQVYLGHQFITDMVVFEVKINSDSINNNFESGWMKSAAHTLSEAMVLAAGRLLDVEFTDIKAGHRIRRGEGGIVIDIFLYDSLSSGAGYSSELAHRTDDLLSFTRDILEGCDCDSSCPNCIDHFWNQSRKKYLNRHFGTQLLNWAQNSTLADEFSFNEQKNKLTVINDLSESDNDFVIESRNGKFYVKNDIKSFELYLYPTMWSINHSRIPRNTMAIDENMLTQSLPLVFLKILKKLKGDY